MIIDIDSHLSPLSKDMNVVESVGLRIAEQRDLVLYEGKGEKITMGELMEGDFATPFMKASTALMLFNTKRYFENLDETTRLVHIGDFQKYAFDMVRALFPSLAAHEWASVQPMQGPVSLVFYMKFIYNTTKGTALAGQDIIENPNETYSSEIIDSENLGTGDGVDATPTVSSLSFTPIKPGTLSISAEAGGVVLTLTDDGNGNLTGDGSGTVDYDTGALGAVTFSTAPDNGAAIEATYQYDSEANDNIPEVDLTLTSSPVSAVVHKLRTRWSTEAQQDLKATHGLEAEQEQVAGVTAELKYEIDRTVARDMLNIALNEVAAFNRSPAAGISFTEHKLLFKDKLIEANNKIFQSTQRANGTWINAGTNVCSLLESLPGFQALPKPANTRGVYKAGTLNGQWDIWKDPTFPAAQRNQTNENGFLMGYKGQNMWEVGYIFAPYVLAYTTPTVFLDDFVGRKGIASRYGKKAIDGRFFCKGSISGSPFA